MAGHVINPSTKCEDPTTICSWVMSSDISHRIPLTGEGRLFEARFQGEGVVSLRIYWYHSKGNWLRYNVAAESFYIMKLFSRLSVLYCRNCPKRRQIYVLYPHFEEVRGSVEPWLMAHWKARVELLLSVIELLFAARRFASAVLAIAVPSVCPSVTRWYCVKTTALSRSRSYDQKTKWRFFSGTLCSFISFRLQFGKE